MSDITTLEKKAGVIATSKSDLPKDIKKPEDLSKYAIDNPKNLTLVNYDDRVKFLKDNGYEVTRDNLINRELSVRQPEE